MDKDAAQERGLDSQMPGARRVAIWGFLLAAIAAGIALRWVGLGKLSLWWDEGFTAWTAKLRPDDIIRFAGSDNQPPLYYLFEHYWASLFGTSEFALRASSAFFGTLSIPLLYLLARKVLRNITAVAVAVWLFAFSFRQVWYSREARAYEMASFFALAGLYSLVVFLESDSRIAFTSAVISAAISLYLHNMMAFYVLSLNVFWLIYPSPKTWARRVKELFVADILIGLLYLPWLVTLFTQVAAVRGNLNWVPRPTFWTVVGTLTNTSGFAMSYLYSLATRLVPFSSRSLWLFLCGTVILLCFALLACGIWRVPKPYRDKTVSLVLYCLVPIALVFVLSRKALPLYIDRVFTPSSIVVPVAFAIPLALQTGRKLRTLYAVVGIVIVTTALSAFGFLRYQEAKEKNNEDWRGLTSTLLTLPEKNRLVVFVPPAAGMLFDYYCERLPRGMKEIRKISLPIGFNEQFPPPKSKPIEANAIVRLKDALASGEYSEVDLVVAHQADPEGLTADYLNRMFGHKESEQVYGTTVKLIRFVNRSPGVARSRENSEFSLGGARLNQLQRPNAN